MRLQDILDVIYNKTDYKPKSSAYTSDLISLINESYYELFYLKPWQFAQKTSKIKIWDDQVTSTGSVTNGSTTITSAVPFFSGISEGMIIDIDGIEYEIVEVTSINTAYIEKEYQGSTHINAQFTIKHRYIDMPYDCINILSINHRDFDVTDTDREHYVPVPRYDDELSSLSVQDRGRIYYWLPYDDVQIETPVQAPVVTADLTVNWPAGTYTIGYTFVKQNRYSALSPTTEITLDGTNGRPEVTFKNYGVTGHHKQTWVKFSPFNEFRLFGPQVESEDVGPMTSTAPGDDWQTIERLYNNEGHYKRIRFYMRQDEDADISVRYLYKPQRLIEDYDTPAIPSQYHMAIVHKVLEQLSDRHGDKTGSARYQDKFEKMLVQMAQRELSPETMVFTKGSWDSALHPLHRTNRSQTIRKI